MSIATSTTRIDERIAKLGQLDPELAAGYQTLVSQLDYDGLWTERRERMVANALTIAITSFHAAPLDEK